MTAAPTPPTAPAWPGELVLASGTLRHASFPDRVAAAASVGACLGLATGAYARLREQGWTDGALRAVLDDAGVRLVESEGLMGFAATGQVPSGPLAGRRYADPETEARLLAMAGAFGLRHVNVNGAFTAALEPDATEAFAGLCDRMAAAGLIVALEPVPCSNVPDLATALRVVTEADRPNGRLCVDSWHLYRGGGDERELRDLPADRVAVIQLDDGPVAPVDPDYLVDTLHHRAVPGEGELPLPAFLRALHDAGVRAPLSVEVLSDVLDALPSGEAAQRVAAGTRALLAQVAPPSVRA